MRPDSCVFDIKIQGDHMLFHRFAFALLLSALTTTSFASSTLWQDLSLSQITQTGERFIKPRVARILALDHSALTQQLFAAENEFSGRAGSTLQVPMPDGSMAEFAIWQTDLMHPDLAAKYPQIQTWIGQGITDPNASARFDWGLRGFHGMILSPQGTVYIDPLQRGDLSHYQSYLKQHAQRRHPAIADQVIQAEGSLDVAKSSSHEPRAQAAGTLRQYRLAIAATGDYSHFHDAPALPMAGLADKAVVLSEMVNAVNRVVGIYEREFSVRMQLVANNDAVIFQHPLADPYVDGALTGLEGLPMLFTNTPILDALIGAENYDIGHVFSVGGGGVAQLGSVCGGSKGAGVTGLPEPVADPFYVDYVAHEIGHQFGANHTFNGVNGSCSGGNRNGSTAYEPGSATTIMGYAGICGDDNIQNNSDDYFHGVSFDEVHQFVSQAGGLSCAEEIEIDNQAPIANAGRGGFSIPHSTPFELTGTASDPDGDAWTAQWEQFDLGPAIQAGGAPAEGPLFRSYQPSTSTTRVFPRMEDLAANRSDIAEVLPQGARDLSFRFTVRDNHPGSGGIANALLRFKVAGDAGPFRVTAPAGGSSYPLNEAITVNWDVANTDAAPVNCSHVDISLSEDGGLSYPISLLNTTANDGEESVTLPGQNIADARIKVKCSDNVFFAISGANFSVGLGATARELDISSNSSSLKGGSGGWLSLLGLAALGLGRRRRT